MKSFFINHEEHEEHEDNILKNLRVLRALRCLFFIPHYIKGKTLLGWGSVVNLNIIPGMVAHAYPLKSLGDVIVLSNDLIAKLERASLESDAELLDFRKQAEI